MEKCAGCNEGLATLSGGVDVRFIALLSPFDRAQGPVCGENPWVELPEMSSLFRGVGSSRRHKRDGEVRWL